LSLSLYFELKEPDRIFLATAVAFLTTRVKSSDEDDLKKLTHMIRYLCGSIELPLILRADSVPVPKWWVDGSHATHPNMRGHSSGCMSLGKGMPINTSTKQKINTRSSTETELVAANDFMPIILWTNYFLEAQGYGHQDTILYQDNQNAILLEKNGHKSSSKRTKHLNCRFYFIPTVSILMNSPSSIVLPMRWSEIFIPSLYKANSFTSSENLS
jgi:hypothetical protein